MQVGGRFSLVPGQEQMEVKAKFTHKQDEWQKELEVKASLMSAWNTRVSQGRSRQHTSGNNKAHRIALDKGDALPPKAFLTRIAVLPNSKTYFAQDGDNSRRYGILWLHKLGSLLSCLFTPVQTCAFRYNGLSFVYLIYLLLIPLFSEPTKATMQAPCQMWLRGHCQVMLSLCKLNWTSGSEHIVVNVHLADTGKGQNAWSNAVSGGYCSLGGRQFDVDLRESHSADTHDEHMIVTMFVQVDTCDFTSCQHSWGHVLFEKRKLFECKGSWTNSSPDISANVLTLAVCLPRSFTNHEAGIGSLPGALAAEGSSECAFQLEGLLWRANIFSREVYNNGQWYKMRVVTNAGGSAAQENGFLDSIWVTAVMGTVNTMLCSVLELKASYRTKSAVYGGQGSPSSGHVVVTMNFDLDLQSEEAENSLIGGQLVSAAGLSPKGMNRKCQLFASTHKEQNTVLASSSPELASTAQEENPGSGKTNRVGPRAVSHRNLVCVPCGKIKQKVPSLGQRSCHLITVSMRVKVLMRIAAQSTVAVPKIHLPWTGSVPNGVREPQHTFMQSSAGALGPGSHESEGVLFFVM
ncbi:hypothetical protein ACRRTK_020861 [Alexandromys fortis]